MHGRRQPLSLALSFLVLSLCLSVPLLCSVVTADVLCQSRLLAASVSLPVLSLSAAQSAFASATSNPTAGFCDATRSTFADISPATLCAGYAFNARAVVRCSAYVYVDEASQYTVRYGAAFASGAVVVIDGQEVASRWTSSDWRARWSSDSVLVGSLPLFTGWHRVETFGFGPVAATSTTLQVLKGAPAARGESAFAVLGDAARSPRTSAAGGAALCVSGCGSASGRGTCTNTDERCRCLSGWTGADCGRCTSTSCGATASDTCTASVTCTGGGVCTASGSCMCYAGYGGADCGCRPVEVCHGHATCDSATGACICQGGWEGPYCDHAVVPAPSTPSACNPAIHCNGRGTCLPSGQCQCFAGFGGQDCACDQQWCSGHGRCTTDGKCLCDAGFGGADCACQASVNCSGHGTCTLTGGCVCDAGWFGTDCSVPVNAALVVSPLGAEAAPVLLSSARAAAVHVGRVPTAAGIVGALVDFRVRYSLSPSMANHVELRSSSTPVTVSNLLPGITYYFQGAAGDGVTTSPFGKISSLLSSQCADLESLEMPPSSVVNVPASFISNLQAVVFAVPSAYAENALHFVGTPSTLTLTLLRATIQQLDVGYHVMSTAGVVYERGIPFAAFGSSPTGCYPAGASVTVGPFLPGEVVSMFFRIGAVTYYSSPAMAPVGGDTTHVLAFTVQGRNDILFAVDAGSVPHYHDAFLLVSSTGLVDTAAFAGRLTADGQLATAPTPIQYIVWGVDRFATLDMVHADRADRSCQVGALALPAGGWRLATNSTATVSVVAAHQWGTDVVLLGDSIALQAFSGAVLSTSSTRVLSSVLPSGVRRYSVDGCQTRQYGVASPARILITMPADAAECFQEIVPPPAITNTIVLDGREFATLDNTPPSDSPLPYVDCAPTLRLTSVPVGWTLADDDLHTRAAVMGAANRFGTRCLALANGRAIDTASVVYCTGALHPLGFLKQVGPFVGASTCDSRVLIVRDVPLSTPNSWNTLPVPIPDSSTVQLGSTRYAVIGAAPPSLPCAPGNPSCTSRAAALPEGWSVADLSSPALRELLRQSTFGAFCGVGSGGSSLQFGVSPATNCLDPRNLGTGALLASTRINRVYVASSFCDAVVVLTSSVVPPLVGPTVSVAIFPAAAVNFGDVVATVVPPVLSGGGAVIGSTLRWSLDPNMLTGVTELTSTGTQFRLSNFAEGTVLYLSALVTNVAGPSPFGPRLTVTVIVPKSTATPPIVVVRRLTGVFSALSVRAVWGNEQYEATVQPPSSTGGYPITGYRVQYSVSGNFEVGSPDLVLLERIGASPAFTFWVSGGVFYARAAVQTAAGWSEYGPIVSVGACIRASECNAPNNGVCTDGVCRCFAGIGGPYCACRPVETCNGRGTCTPYGTCNCNGNSWFGEFCQFCVANRCGPNCDRPCVVPRPPSMVVQPQGCNTINVAVNPDPNDFFFTATPYRLQWSLNPWFPVNATTTVGPQSGGVFVLTTMPALVPIYLRATVENVVGVSSPSVVAPVTITAAQTPSPPILSSRAVDCQFLMLITPTDLGGCVLLPSNAYSLRYTLPGGTSGVLGPQSSPLFVVNSLPRNVTIAFTGYIATVSGPSAASNELRTVLTDVTPPEPPTELLFAVGQCSIDATVFVPESTLCTCDFLPQPYRLTVATSPSFAPGTVVSTFGPQADARFHLTTLPGNVVLYFAGTVENGAGISAPVVSSLFIPARPLPSAPTVQVTPLDCSVTVVVQSGTFLGCDPSPVTYTLMWSAINTTTTTLGPQLDPQFVLLSLPRQTLVTLQASVTTPSGTSPLSMAVSLTLPADRVPGKPTVSAVADTGCDVEADVVPSGDVGCTSAALPYVLEWSTVATFAAANTTRLGPQASTRFVVTDPPRLVPLYWRAATQNAVGFSSFSDVVVHTVASETLPSTPNMTIIQHTCTVDVSLRSSFLGCLPLHAPYSLQWSSSPEFPPASTVTVGPQPQGDFSLSSLPRGTLVFVRGVAASAAGSSVSDVQSLTWAIEPVPDTPSVTVFVQQCVMQATVAAATFVGCTPSAQPYILQYSTNSTFPVQSVTLGPQSAPLFAVPNLPRGVPVFVRGFVSSSVGMSSPSVVVNTTMSDAAPGRPTLTVTVVQCVIRVVVNISPNVGCGLLPEPYTLQYSLNDPGFSVPATVTVGPQASSVFVFTNLTRPSAVYFRATVSDSSGPSQPSLVTPIVLFPLLPPNPPTVRVSVRPDHVSLSVNVTASGTPPGAQVLEGTGYFLRWNTQPVFNDSSTVFLGPQPQSTFVLAGLPLPSRICVVGQTSNCAGISSTSSPPVCVGIPDNVFPEGPDVTLLDFNATALVATVGPVVNNGPPLVAAPYYLEYVSNSTFASGPVHTLPAQSSPTFFLYNLEPGAIVCARARLENMNGLGPYGPVSCRQLPPVPPGPTVELNRTSVDSVRVIITPPTTPPSPSPSSDVREYQAQWSTDATFASDVHTSDWVLSPVVDFVSLPTDVLLCFRARVRVNGIVGEWSEPRCMTLYARRPEAPPVTVSRTGLRAVDVTVGPVNNTGSPLVAEPYRLQWSTSATFDAASTTIIGPQSTPTFSLANLTLDVEFFFRATAENLAGESAPGPAVNITLRDRIPDAPLVTLVVTGTFSVDAIVGNATVTAFYSPVTDYRLQWSRDSFVSDVNTLPQQPTDTFHVDSLPAGVWLEFRAAAGNAAGFSPYGPVSRVKLNDVPPEGPPVTLVQSDLRAVTATVGPVVNRGTPLDPAPYVLQWSTSPTFDVGVGVQELGPQSSSTFANIEPLPLATPLFFRAAAINGAGRSAFGPTSNITLPAIFVPDAPPPPLAVVAAPTIVNVTVLEPAFTGYLPIIAYRIRYGSAGSSSSTELPAQSTPAFVLTGLTPGQTIFVESSVQNAAGWSDWSNATLVTPDERPSAPALVLHAVTYITLTANVSAVANSGSSITEYVLQYSTDPSFVSAQERVSATPSLITLQPLSPATTYYVRAAVRNGAGQSDWSEVVNATTLAIPLCPAVNLTMLTARAVLAEVLDPLSKFVLYKLRFSQDPTFPAPLVTIERALQSSPLFVLTGLVPGRELRVEAGGAVEVGAVCEWGPMSSITPDAVPGPANVTVLAVTGVVVQVRVGDPVINEGSALTGRYALRYRYTLSNGTEVVTEVQQTGRDFTVSDLPRSTYVLFAGAAANLAGFGPYGAEVNATTHRCPDVHQLPDPSFVVPCSSIVCSGARQLFVPGQPVLPALLPTRTDPNLHFIISPSSVTVTLVDEHTALRNALQYFVVNETADVVESGYVFRDASFEPDGCLQSGDSTVIGPFRPGLSLGFIVLVDGYRVGEAAAQRLYSLVSQPRFPSPTGLPNAAVGVVESTDQIVFGLEDQPSLTNSSYSSIVLLVTASDRIDTSGIFPKLNDTMMPDEAPLNITNFVTVDGGRFYWAVLDDAHPQRLDLQCQYGPRALPEGWTLAVNTTEASSAASKFGVTGLGVWGTSMLLTADGVALSTIDGTPVLSGARIIQSAVNPATQRTEYWVDGCLDDYLNVPNAARILITKRIPRVVDPPFNITNSIVFEGVEYATIRNTPALQSPTVDCDHTDRAATLPSGGWALATMSTETQAAVLGPRFRFGVECLVLANGTSISSLTAQVCATDALIVTDSGIRVDGTGRAYSTSDCLSAVLISRPTTLPSTWNPHVSLPVTYVSFNAQRYASLPNRAPNDASVPVAACADVSYRLPDGWSTAGTMTNYVRDHLRYLRFGTSCLTTLDGQSVQLSDENTVGPRSCQLPNVNTEGAIEIVSSSAGATYVASTYCPSSVLLVHTGSSNTTDSSLPSFTDWFMAVTDCGVSESRHLPYPPFAP